MIRPRAARRGKLRSWLTDFPTSGSNGSSPCCAATSTTASCRGICCRSPGAAGKRCFSPAAVVATLCELPLQFSPGTRWQYGMSTDVVGYLVQVLSGQPLDDYIAEHVTGPLGMNDSGFSVPADKADRFAACYECGSGEPGAPSFHLMDDPATSRYLGPPAMLSGGGGMVATIDDYRRFADMLLGKGELDGVRLLGRKTVEYLTRNHLPDNRDIAAMGQPVFSETPFAGVGFGLGFFSVAQRRSPGQFASAAGTYGSMEELSVIFFARRQPAPPHPPPPQTPHLPGPHRLTRRGQSRVLGSRTHDLTSRVRRVGAN